MSIIAFNDNSKYETQIELALNAPAMVALLENKLRQIDANIGNQNNEQNTEQALLELITNYCQTNHAVLREFPEKTIADQKNLLVETNLFVLEGNFSTLINFVYFLEQKSKLGKVVSVHYQYKKNIKSKDMELTATIYLQNVKKK